MIVMEHQPKSGSWPGMTVWSYARRARRGGRLCLVQATRWFPFSDRRTVLEVWL